MAKLFVIADLHLSGSVQKSMEVFGLKWTGYVNKLESNWRRVVTSEDTVVIPGDFSWGMNLEEALPDFQFLESLPGHKILGKGNHDFWWTTASKMNAYLTEHEIKSVEFLYNNAYAFESCIIAGSRGWFSDPSVQKTVGKVDYQKIVNREVLRLSMSLNTAKKLQSSENPLPIIAFLHFPPLFAEFRSEEIIQCLSAFGVSQCYYGHIHGQYTCTQEFESQGIHFRMISADRLDFTPELVRILPL